MVKSSKVVDSEVQMDRRRNERRIEEAASSQVAANTVVATPSSGKPVAGTPGAEGTVRRKKQRRRQIDPTTCERDYNGEEIVFMHALDAYKRSSGRMFPTCSEILEVIRSLGYVKLTEEEQTLLAVRTVSVETEAATVESCELAECN